MRERFYLFTPKNGLTVAKKEDIAPYFSKAIINIRNNPSLTQQNELLKQIGLSNVGVRGGEKTLNAYLSQLTTHDLFYKFRDFCKKYSDHLYLFGVNPSIIMTTIDFTGDRRVSKEYITHILRQMKEYKPYFDSINPVNKKSKSTVNPAELVNLMNKISIAGPSSFGAPYPPFNPLAINESKFHNSARYKSVDKKVINNKLVIEWISQADYNNGHVRGVITEITRCVTELKKQLNIKGKIEVVLFSIVRDKDCQLEDSYYEFMV